jgi:UDP-N-acetylmuramoyl-L-alanyl-D-glutamate--2,6-diaminopimelate ligase
VTVPDGPYLVLGCGRAGVAAADALAGRGGVTVWDEHDGPATRARRERLQARGVRVLLEPWEPALLDGARLVVKSPGVPHDAAPVRDALRAGLLVIDELDLGRRLTRRPLVAVTGTDGKSTVCALVAGALGDGVPVVGNTDFGVPLSALPAGDGPAVVEASSYQAEFCTEPFATLAVLTNVTRDHMHRHRTIADYAAIKRRLFIGGGRVVGKAVVSADSEPAGALARELAAAGCEVATFGVAGGAGYRVLDASWDERTAHATIAAPNGDVAVRSRLPGRHNAANVAAAIAASDLLGVPRAHTLATIGASSGVPGRWEHVDEGQPFSAIVDFAHTVAGLEAVLRTARAIADRTGARVLHACSAGGGTDPSKRGPYGRLASTLADRVVVTEGAGRGEPRERVIAAILAGAAPAGTPLEVIPDRRDAIRAVLSGAEPGDIVLVTGRGAMARLISHTSGEGLVFDDRVVVREELRGLGYAAADAVARTREGARERRSRRV